MHLCRGKLGCMQQGSRSGGERDVCSRGAGVGEKGRMRQGRAWLRPVCKPDSKSMA